ncbi:radical SAM protein [Nannocystis sp.]|uniref:radical SAM protein n=1 Tax=Nannocystis sp. TaxID=1962667 RepID=UPI0025FCF00C|nr:radical SAM protein [Nannocystis sp.]MBK7829965.1 hypothetical protein [Nannocystis sp.]
MPPGRGRRVLPAPRGEVQRPGLAVWEFTLACDQRCQACGPRAGSARPNGLRHRGGPAPGRRARRSSASARSCSSAARPTSRNDVLLVIRQIRERGMTCSMTTGGLGLTRQRAEALAEAGLQTVSVSIDGLEASHGPARHPGGWRRCFEALAHARAAGMTIAANTQINRHSWRELPALLGCSPPPARALADVPDHAPRQRRRPPGAAPTTA